MERIELAPRLDLSRSVALADQLNSLRGRDLTVDASGVRFIGAHAVQTLICAATTWRDDGHRLLVELPSEAFLTNLAGLGLSCDDIQLAFLA